MKKPKYRFRRHPKKKISVSIPEIGLYPYQRDAMKYLRERMESGEPIKIHPMTGRVQRDPEYIRFPNVASRLHRSGPKIEAVILSVDYSMIEQRILADLMTKGNSPLFIGIDLASEPDKIGYAIAKVLDTGEVVYEPCELQDIVSQGGKLTELP